MPLIRYSVSDAMWNENTNLIIAIKDHILKLYGPSSGNAFFREDGLSQIPIINSQWCQWVRHEHDELTLWFKPRIRRDPAGFISQEPIGPPAIVPLVKSICWNAAVYIYLFKKPIGTDSVRKAVKQTLINSSCPDKMIDVVAEAANLLCHTLLDAVSDPEGYINKCALQLLQGDLQEKMGRRNCVNKSLRRQICNRLIVEGIATKNTRMEQQNMIRRIVLSEHRLKLSAVRAIERMLSSDPKLLKLNGGVSLLLPYTKEEISAIRKCFSTKAKTFNIEDRIALIKDKINRRIPLTSAERKFKCKHKHLFRCR